MKKDSFKICENCEYFSMYYEIVSGGTLRRTEYGTCRKKLDCTNEPLKKTDCPACNKWLKKINIGPFLTQVAYLNVAQRINELAMIVKLNEEQSQN